MQRCQGSPASDRKSTCLNSSHLVISYAVFCLKKKKKKKKSIIHIKHTIEYHYSVTHYHEISPTSFSALLSLCFDLFCFFFCFFFFFFFNDTATTEIYTLSLHDALPI